MREHLASPAVWNAAKGAPFCLTPSRSWRCAAWHGGGRALGEADRALRGTRILLTASRNPPGSLPMSCWGHLTCRSPQLAHRQPDCSICLPHTHPCPVSDSLCTLKVASMSLCRGLVSTHRKPACEIQRKHANSSISTTLREAHGRQHMAWLCRVERRFPPKEGTRGVKQVIHRKDLR